MAQRGASANNQKEVWQGVLAGKKTGWGEERGKHEISPVRTVGRESKKKAIREDRVKSSRRVWLHKPG